MRMKEFFNMNAQTTERKPDAGIGSARSDGGEGLAQAFGGKGQTQLSEKSARARRTREQRELELERRKYTGANAVDGL